jgi:hypothetical protein
MKKSISNKKKLLYILLCAFFVVSIAFFLFFSNPPKARFNILDVASSFRNSIASTTMNSKAEETMRFGSWDNYWSYTFLGDQLYANITNDSSYIIQSENFLETFMSKGRDNLCLPFLLLSPFKHDSRYADTYTLAETICYGSNEYKEIDRCKNSDDCLIDEDFYNTLAELLSFSNNEFVLYIQEKNLVPKEQALSELESLITENILAYSLEDQDYIDWVNKQILDEVILFRNAYAQTDREIQACDDLAYTNLLKSFFVKEKLINDSTLASQHTRIQDRLLEFCFSSKGTFKEALFNTELDFSEDTDNNDFLPLPFYIDDNLYLRMEMYFLAKESLDLEGIEGFLENYFKNNLLQRVYYESIDFAAEFTEEEVLEKSVKFSPLSRNYFYLLLNSIYED